MTIFRSSATCLAISLLLIGCSEKISDENLICDPSPGVIGLKASDRPSTPVDLEGEAFACIHKWGYRLGRAPGSNAEIAKATIGRCRAGITHLFNQKIAEGENAKEPFTAAAASAWAERFEEEALMRVVQGRAGQCSIRGSEQK